MTTRDTHGRFVRQPQTFAERVEAEVWADLKAATAAVHEIDLAELTYQERAAFLTVAIDTAAERLEWLGVEA